MARTVLAALLALAALVPVCGYAGSEISSQAIEKARNICAHPIAEAERDEGIPRQLLTAISLAESGQWDARRQEIFAWPWTVTSGNRSWAFPTRMAAVKGVLRLQHAGVTNIDVGCMQVNLGWHGTAFMSVSDALDPGENVSFAAHHLKKLFETHHSWSLAVGLYHSATLKYQRPYRRKVIRLWNQARRRAAERHRKDVIARFEAERRTRLKEQLRLQAEIAYGGPLH